MTKQEGKLRRLNLIGGPETACMATKFGPANAGGYALQLVEENIYNKDRQITLSGLSNLQLMHVAHSIVDLVLKDYPDQRRTVLDALYVTTCAEREALEKTTAMEQVA